MNTSAARIYASFYSQKNMRKIKNNENIRIYGVFNVTICHKMTVTGMSMHEKSRLFTLNSDGRRSKLLPMPSAASDANRCITAVKK